MARDLAIDLGTANTLVYQKQKGILFAEPTVIALNKETGAVLAMGEEAWQMIGRTPGYIVAVRPLRSGAISDFEVTEKLIRLILQRSGVNKFARPKVLICVPSALTEVERRAVEEAALSAGARTCFLIEEPMAAAIGAGLPIHEPLGNLVVDVGGGTSEVALISMGGIVTNTAVRVGGFDLDAAIQNWVRREYTVAIGERTAERIKIAIGSAFPLAQEEKAELRGRDLATGLPKTILITSEEIREAIAEPIRTIVTAVVECIGASPPDLVQDVLTHGITLTGGSGMLSGLDMLLSQETEVPVHITEQPLEAVVMGAGRCLEAFGNLKSVLLANR
ncbi:MAG: rod shape-determining protein MreB [Actinomycetota bacterium]|jgi:rod shape-determining protein MreB|nr:rod shape-determining protein MreB [Actinomycetota bacterium]